MMNDMMSNEMAGIGMFSMALIGIVVILAIAALIKYLMK
jgi:hypothetical protein